MVIAATTAPPVRANDSMQASMRSQWKRPPAIADIKELLQEYAQEAWVELGGDVNDRHGEGMGIDPALAEGVTPSLQRPAVGAGVEVQAGNGQTGVVRRHGKHLRERWTAVVSAGTRGRYASISAGSSRRPSVSAARIDSPSLQYTRQDSNLRPRAPEARALSS